MSPATHFGYDMRIVPCANCGAPLDVALKGGAIECSYCRSQNRVAARDDAADRAAARQAAAATVDEAERLQQLRAQDHKRLQPPPAVAQLVEGHEIPERLVKVALNEWLEARARVEAGAAFSEVERLFHLTILLAPTLDARHQRALLGTAVEVLPEASYRQILRCQLARHAILEGDVGAAERWLEAVNTRSSQLLMDTAYRLAASYLAIARHRPAEVLAILGGREGDVPIHDGYDSEAAVLRIHAREQSGDLNGAYEALRAHMKADPRNICAVGEVVRANEPLRLCATTFPLANGNAWTEVDIALRPRPTALGLVGIGVIATIAAFLVYITLSLGGPMILGQTPWDCSKNSPGAVAANTCWIGIVFISLTVATIVARRRAGRLQREGVLTRVRAFNPRMRSEQNKNSTTTYCDFAADVLVEGRWQRVDQSVRRGTPVEAGVYPCLVEPTDATNLQIFLG